MTVQTLREAMTLTPAHRHLLRKLVTIVFLVGVAALLVVFARRVEWPQVIAALREYRASTLLGAAAMAGMSYAVYSTFDLLGRHYTGHTLRPVLVMKIAFVCYAFTQTLTAWVGGIAMRFRLYSRYGISKGDIAQIFSISILTNWIGYLLLASVVCIAGFVRPPASWPVDPHWFRVCGALLIFPVAIYLFFCHRFPHHSRRMFGQEWQFPPLRMALLQVIGGAANWTCMAAVIFILLRGQADYSIVLGILLLSSVAAVIAHIPAGLGVLEALFVTLLHDIDRHQVLAAMVGYRAVYYLGPLIPATLAYAYIESRAKKARAKA